MQSGTIKVLRWIGFIPCAFIASAIISYVIIWITKFLPWWVAWWIAGFLSGVTFMIVGMMLAPNKSATVKWTLFIILCGAGVISIVDGYITSDKPYILGGIALTFAAIAGVRTKFDEY